MLKIVKITKCHQNAHFPYTMKIFRMCVSDTLPQFPAPYLTQCQKHVTHLSNWCCLLPQCGISHCVGIVPCPLCVLNKY